jgi:hypothetical protein
MSKIDTDDLRLPSEWAEHFGITGLVEDQWQEHARISGYGDTAVMADVPDWQRAMTEQEFKRAVHGGYKPTYADDVPRHQRTASVPRTKKMPKFAPTDEAVSDALGSFRGWIDTSGVTQALAEPLGWSNQVLPPNGKVLTRLKAMREAGTVVEHDDVEDKRRIPNARRGDGNSKMWLLVSSLNDLIEDRRLDEEEHKRRRTKAATFVASLDPALVPDVAYSNRARLAFEDGTFIPDADSGTITMAWTTLERLIDIATTNQGEVQ